MGATFALKLKQDRRGSAVASLVVSAGNDQLYSTNASRGEGRVACVLGGERDNACVVPKNGGEKTNPLVGGTSLPRRYVGRDDQQRHARAIPQVVDIRWRNVIVESAIVIPGNENDGR